MSGLDDELLGLVDDESGSEAPASEKAASPSPPRSPGELSDDDDDKMGRKGTAQPVPKRRRAPKYVDEGEEEGELYVFVASILIRPSCSQHVEQIPHSPWFHCHIRATKQKNHHSLTRITFSGLPPHRPLITPSSPHL